MKGEHLPVNKYHEYNGTKIWIPHGYAGSVTNRLYRKYPNPEKQYTEYTIQNVSLDIETGEKEFDTYFKSDDNGIVCDLVEQLSEGQKSTTSGIYLTHEQIGIFLRNETKAMLSDFDNTYPD